MNANLLDAPALPQDALRQARDLIGTEIRLEHWNHEATRDTIRHYAWGIGDDNPLYFDPEYAAGTKWGGIIAPPVFYYGISDCAICPGLPDIQWYYVGCEWTFHKPVQRGYEMHMAARYLGATEASGRNCDRMILQTGDVTFTNQYDEHLATVLSTTARIARPNAAGGMRYQQRPPHSYTDAEIDRLQDAMLSEYRRGSDRLYWEEVDIGDALPQVVRGPITQLDMTCYYAGAVGTSGYKSTKLRAKYRRWALQTPEKLPNNMDASYYGAKILPSIGHQIADVAVKSLGMPGPYDNGGQRIGMMATCVTNWMGDDGFMRAYKARLTRPLIFGDTNFFEGKVVGKRLEAGLGLVDIEVWGDNQLGERTINGTAVVELPRLNVQPGH